VNVPQGGKIRIGLTTLPGLIKFTSEMASLTHRRHHHHHQAKVSAEAKKK
jgi:hypothetical protein